MSLLSGSIPPVSISVADVYEFYNLGIGEPFSISSVNKLGFGELLDEVTSHFDKEAAAEEEDERTKVAIVGKPNVGKALSHLPLRRSPAPRYQPAPQPPPSE